MRTISRPHPHLLPGFRRIVAPTFAGGIGRLAWPVFKGDWHVAAPFKFFGFAKVHGPIFTVCAMAIFGYGRVSTKEQTTENQNQEIERAGYAVEYWYADEGVSGKV